MPKLFAMNNRSPRGEGVGLVRRIHFSKPVRGRVEVTSSYAPDLVSLIKRAPGSTWDPKGKVWTIPAERVSEIATWAAAHNWELEGVHGGDSGDELPALTGIPNPRLHPYQLDAVLRALKCREFLFLFEVGLGKSGAALETCRLAGAQKILIVCPKVVRGSWVEQFRQWWPARVDEIHQPINRKDAKLDAGITIVSYGLLDAVTQWCGDAIIIDEIHYVKESSAGRSAQVKKISDANPGALKLGLTATPIANRPKDLFAQLQTLCPGRFGHWISFTDRYCEVSDNGYGRDVGAARADTAPELRARLASFSAVVTKAEVAHLLPPLTTETLWLENAEAQAEVSHALAVAGVDEGDTRQATRIANQTLQSVKIEAVADIVEYVEGPIAVFTHLRSTARQIGDSLPNSIVVDGAVDAQKRMTKIHQYLDDCASTDQRPILVATMHSLGIGIDLTTFPTLILAEQYWSPTVMVQAIGRFHRLSSKLPAKIMLLVAKGTVDEAIALSLVTKLDDVARILAKPTLAGAQLQKALQGDETFGNLDAELANMITSDGYLSDDIDIDE